MPPEPQPGCRGRGARLPRARRAPVSASRASAGCRARGARRSVPVALQRSEAKERDPSGSARLPQGCFGQLGSFSLPSVFKRTHRQREQLTGRGRSEMGLEELEAQTVVCKDRRQGCVEQHEEHSPSLVKAVNGVQPLNITCKIKYQLKSK